MERVESYRYNLYSRNNLFLKEIDGIDNSGSLTGNTQAQIKWSGKVSYHGEEISGKEWSQYRLQPVLCLNRLEYEKALAEISTPDDYPTHNLLISSSGGTIGETPWSENFTEDYTDPPGRHGYSLMYTGAGNTPLHKPSVTFSTIIGHSYYLSFWAKTDTPGVTLTMKMSDSVWEESGDTLVASAPLSTHWEKITIQVLTATKTVLECGVTEVFSSLPDGDVASTTTWIAGVFLTDLSVLSDAYTAAKEAYREIPLGIYIVKPENLSYKQGHHIQSLDLYDKTFLLSVDSIEKSTSLQKGDNIFDFIQDMIESVGESVALPETPVYSTANLVWEAGTSKLTIVNDVLQASGFFALYCDFNGGYIFEKYLPPKKRSLLYEFTARSSAVHTEEYSREQDAKIPNKIICISQSDGIHPALVSVALNENPDNEFSFQSQGMWISKVYTGVEAMTQEILDSKAQEYLSLINGVATFKRTMVVEGIPLNSRVSGESGEDEVIENIDITLTPGSLMTVTTREVV